MNHGSSRSQRSRVDHDQLTWLRMADKGVDVRHLRPSNSRTVIDRLKSSQKNLCRNAFCTMIWMQRE